MELNPPGARECLHLPGTTWEPPPNFPPVSSPAPGCTQRNRRRMRRRVVPVSKLVGHGEGQGQPRVLVDVAAPVGLAHPGHMGQPQGLTGPVHGSTDVLPGARGMGKHRQTHGQTDRQRAERALEGGRTRHTGTAAKQEPQWRRATSFHRGKTLVTFPLPFPLPSIPRPLLRLINGSCWPAWLRLSRCVNKADAGDNQAVLCGEAHPRGAVVFQPPRKKHKA